MSFIYYNMANEKFKLEDDDEIVLNNFVRKSKEVQRAVILLFLSKGMKNVEIANLLDVGVNTVSRIKNKYLKNGLEIALHDKQRSGQPKKYGTREEMEIIALACSDPPEGRKAWSLRLIAETLNQKEGFETLNRESVRIILKKAKLSLGKSECGV
ncbi:hypothetical protein MBCUT_13290 [Methanobrevibacter cuticularis]|uniref:Transposase n=1 Tax=Methanobrevibacter cuticularis TaxID=47311 RepID=A0A166DLB6_9EURY|nr:hypothetical protein MBCUT_13290 [Methanobrevibacter cuticularis]